MNRIGRNCIVLNRIKPDWNGLKWFEMKRMEIGIESDWNESDWTAPSCRFPTRLTHAYIRCMHEWECQVKYRCRCSYELLSTGIKWGSFPARRRYVTTSFVPLLPPPPPLRYVIRWMKEKKNKEREKKGGSLIYFTSPPLFHSSIHPCIHSFIQLFIHPFHSLFVCLIYLFRSFICSLQPSLSWLLSKWSTRLCWRVGEWIAYANGLYANVAVCETGGCFQLQHGEKSQTSTARCVRPETHTRLKPIY